MTTLPRASPPAAARAGPRPGPDKPAWQVTSPPAWQVTSPPAPGARPPGPGRRPEPRSLGEPPLPGQARPSGRGPGAVRPHGELGRSHSDPHTSDTSRSGPAPRAPGLSSGAAGAKETCRFTQTTTRHGGGRCWGRRSP